jgi:hypothetical protein
MIEFDPDIQVPPYRAKRILAALIAGLSPDAIGAEENLPTPTVERALMDELGRRWRAPAAEFAKIQIARLENLCLQIIDRVEVGDLDAVKVTAKILDRFDRYHGFQRARAPVEEYSEAHRDRLLAKLNAAAANLAATEASMPSGS